MARLPRMDIPGIPQHVVQRGNNRMPCFLDDGDRRHYLRCLAEALPRFGVALHAYVLMDNHVHLLLTPAEKGAVSRLMQSFARNYAGWFNVRRARTGTLWEGRFHSCLVDSEQYLLRCQRYIELNPVRAGLAPSPAQYRWSSHRAHIGATQDAMLTPHPAHLALAPTPDARIQAYRALFAETMAPDDVERIRQYTRQQRALGPAPFQQRVAQELHRFAAVRPPHRPAQTTVSDTVTAAVSVSDTVKGRVRA